jgi:hypothetical protein
MNFGLQEDDRNEHRAPHAMTEMNFGLQEDDRNEHRAPTRRPKYKPVFAIAVGLMEIEH